MVEKLNSVVSEEYLPNDKVLYVCRANMGRSQVAASLHNHYAPGRAESAGTQIDEISADYIEQWNGSNIVIEAMRKRGIDISQNRRRQIDREKAANFGKVIIMAELDARPLYLLGFDNATIWNIADLKDLKLSEADEVINEIDRRVKIVVKAQQANQL